MQFLCACFFMVWQPAQSSVRNHAEAERIATTTMGAPVVSVHPLIRQQGNAALAPVANGTIHIFNSSEGDRFVVISGSDRMPEILGYCDNNGFDPTDVPPQLAGLLAEYARAAARIEEDADYCMPAPRKASAPVLLSTAQWDQGAPYNMYCPTKYTGCGPTAMAIILKYHHAFGRGRGSHSYDWHGQTLSYDFSQKIVYDNMADTYGSMYTAAQGEAVARLMQACGVAMEADYGDYGTSSLTSRTTSFAEFFGYSNMIDCVRSSDFTSSEWSELIDRELDADRPILYRGADMEDSNGGHIFVVDGRDAEGLYHVNWGWSGSYNGYFALDDFHPGNSHDYSFNHWMTVNIFPDDLEAVYDPLFIPKYMNPAVPGMVMNQTSVHANDDNLMVIVQTVFNRSSDVLNAKLGIGLFDTFGQIVEVHVADAGINLEPGYYYDTYRFSSVLFSRDALPGETVRAVYRKSDGDRWRQIPAGYGMTSSLPATGYAPEFATVEWNIPTLAKVGVYKGMTMEHALKYASYSFWVRNDGDVKYSVLIDGNRLGCIGSDEHFDYYMTDPVMADRLTITLVDAAGMEESAIVPSGGATSVVDIYTSSGYRLMHRITHEDMDEVMNSLPAGLYFIKEGAGVRKILKR